MMTQPKLDLRAYQTFLHTKGFGARPKPLSREQVRAGRELRMAHKAEAARWPNCMAVPEEHVYLPKLDRTYLRYSNGRVEKVCDGRLGSPPVRKRSLIRHMIDGIKTA